MTKSASESKQREHTTPPKPVPTLPMRILKCVDWVSRCVSCLAVMTLISWMAWVVLQDRSHFGGSRQAKSQLTLASSSEGVGDVLDGQWHFADVPGSIKIDCLPEEKAFNQVNRPAPPAGELGRDGSTVWTEVFDILDSLNAVIIVQQDTVQYRVEKPGFCLVGFAPQSNRKAVGCVRLAQASPDGTWNYLEFSSQSATKTTEAENHLLPISGGGAALASKRDTSGKLLAELMSTELSLQEVRRSWENDGWAIEEVDAAKLAMKGLAEVHQELTTNAQSKSVIICSKQGNTVAVVPQNTFGGETLSLLLIRLAQK